MGCGSDLDERSVEIEKQSLIAPQRWWLIPAVECGAAHGALAMTTPGDTTMVTRDEVLRVMKGGGARIAR